MAAIKFTDEEQAIMRELKGEQHKLYFFIKSRMDFKTGISGIVTRNSMQAFLEYMNIARTQGRKDKRYTRDDIKYALECIEKSGLIKDFGNYVYECVLADRDESVQNKFAEVSPDVSLQVSTQVSTIENLNNLEKNSKIVINGMEVFPQNSSYVFLTQGTMFPPPPDILYINKSKDLFISEENKPVEKKRKGRKPGIRTLVPADFQVTKEHEDFAKEHGTPDPHGLRIKFITHWQAKREMRPDWNASFKNFLLIAKEIEEGKKAKFANSSWQKKEQKSTVKPFITPEKEQKTALQKDIERAYKSAWAFFGLANNDMLNKEEQFKHKEEFLKWKSKLESLGGVLGEREMEEYPW
jgi:hypothetical protein